MTEEERRCISLRAAVDIAQAAMADTEKCGCSIEVDELAGSIVLAGVRFTKDMATSKALHVYPCRKTR